MTRTKAHLGEIGMPIVTILVVKTLKTSARIYGRRPRRIIKFLAMQTIEKKERRLRGNFQFPHSGNQGSDWRMTPSISKIQRAVSKETWSAQYDGS